MRYSAEPGALEPTRGTGAIQLFQSRSPRVAQLQRSNSCSSPPLVQNKEMMRSPSTAVSVSRSELGARQSGGPAESLLAAANALVAQSNQAPEPTRGIGSFLLFQSRWPCAAQH